MAEEILFPDGVYSGTGWNGTGSNISEGIAAADGNEISSDATGEGDVVTIDMADIVDIVDADTITNVAIVLRGRVTTDGGDESFEVDLVIGGTPQGAVGGSAGELTNTHQTLGSRNTGAWNSDWTVAQLNGMQVDVVGVQGGMPTANTWHIDTLQVVITYTPAPTSTIYERTLNSDIDAQDQQQAYENKLRSIISSLNLNDTISSVVSVAPILRILSSGLNVSDEIKSTSLHLVTLASSLNVQDSAVVEELLVRALLSTLDTNDLLIRTIQLYVAAIERTLSSNINVDDGTLERLQDINYTTANNVDANDNIIRTIESANVIAERFLSSNLEINDKLIAQVLAIRLATDNIELFDLLLREIFGGVLFTRVLASSLDINDNVSQSALLFRLLIGSVSASDTLHIEKLLLRSLNDNTEVADAIVSLIQGVIKTRVLSSELNIFDAILLVSNSTRLLSSAVEFNESLQIEKLLNRKLTDTTEITDAIISLLQGIILTRVLSSEIEILDALDIISNLTRGLTSLVGLNDAALTAKLLRRSLNDSANVQDAISSLITSIADVVVRIFGSSISVSDNQLYNKEFTRGVLSSIVAVDSLLQDKNLSRLLLDNTELFDAIIRTYIPVPQGLQRILSDNVNLQDEIVRELWSLVRGYILMNIKSKGVEISTSKGKGHALEWFENLATYSEQMDNAAYLTSTCTIDPNVGTDPNGELTADKMIPNVGSTYGGALYRIYPTIVNSLYGFSIHLKYLDIRYAFFRLFSPANDSQVVEIDLINGTSRITYYDPNADEKTFYAIAPKLTKENNGYYRITLRGFETVQTSLRAFVFFSDVPHTVEPIGIPLYAGDGVKGNYVWGNQFNKLISPDYNPVDTYTKTEESIVELYSESKSNRPFMNTENSNIKIDTRN